MRRLAALTTGGHPRRWRRKLGGTSTMAVRIAGARYVTRRIVKVAVWACFQAGALTDEARLGRWTQFEQHTLGYNSMAGCNPPNSVWCRLA